MNGVEGALEAELSVDWRRACLEFTLAVGIWVPFGGDLVWKTFRSSVCVGGGGFLIGDSVSAMAARRASWLRALAVHQEDGSGNRRENDENVNPMVGDEVENMVQERHVLVRCQPRRHPRIPLRDITHLFPGSGNIASLDDKTVNLSPRVQQAQGNGPVRRPLLSSSSQNSRKRRQPQPSSETETVRRVLPKFR